MWRWGWYSSRPDSEDIGVRVRMMTVTVFIIESTRMWADAQRDGRPAEYRWRPLFNAAKCG